MDLTGAPSLAEQTDPAQRTNIVNPETGKPGIWAECDWDRGTSTKRLAGPWWLKKAASLLLAGPRHRALLPGVVATRHFQLLVKGFDNSDFKAYNDIKDMLQMFSTGMNASTRRILSEAIAEKER